MTAARADKEPWDDTHTVALIRSMVRILLASRSQIYATSELAGVSDHGCNRINTKLQQVLKKMCAASPGAEKIVDEEVKATSKAKTPSPKKRKVKDEEE